jgi:hypothetical protein
MTVSETLALNVDSVRSLGGVGEPDFGSPRTLENHNELNDWIEGLRASDGSGCVSVVRTSKPGINVLQKCLEAEERKKTSPRARGDFSHGNPPNS